MTLFMGPTYYIREGMGGGYDILSDIFSLDIFILGHTPDLF